MCHSLLLWQTKGVVVAIFGNTSGQVVKCFMFDFLAMPP